MVVKQFNHVKLPQLDFDLVAETTDSGRVYITPEGNRYNSVTTVLSKLSKEGIDAWRAAVGEEEANKIAGRASRRGSALHESYELYVANNLSSMKIKMMMPNIKELFLQLKDDIDTHVDNVYAIEQALYSDKLKVAGRTDLIAEWDKELAIIDYKTSSKEKLEENIQNYFIQGTCYALMFEEITGIVVDKIVIAIAVEERSKPQIFVKNKHNYINSLMKVLED